MPKMPPRPCTAPRCAEYATKEGRCDKHQREAWSTSKGRSAKSRGYGYAWKKLRDRILKRDNYLCQVCLKSNRVTQATEVDHIKNKAQGGDDNPDNLQSICSACHKQKTSKERLNND